MLRAAEVLPDDRMKKITYLGIKGGLGEYLFSRGFFTPLEVADLLECTEGEVLKLLTHINSRVPQFINKLVPKEKMSYLERNFYMQNQLSKDTDYMGMWHGVEVRVPFLDKDLMELLFSINPDIRYDANQLKYLLTRAFDHILP